MLDILSKLAYDDAHHEAIHAGCPEALNRKKQTMLKKRYLSDGKICKVTFILPSRIDAQSVMLVGDFNNWDKTATPMKQAKNGSWQVDVKLEAGQEYQFRYFVNEKDWHNDSDADKFAVHPYGGENSAVVT